MDFDIFSLPNNAAEIRRLVNDGTARDRVLREGPIAPSEHLRGRFEAVSGIFLRRFETFAA
jgi:hypothetical protein